MDVLAQVNPTTPITERSESKSDPWSSAMAWTPGNSVPAFIAADIASQAKKIRQTAYILLSERRLGVAIGGTVSAASRTGFAGHQVVGMLPPLYPEWLGDRSFCEVHGTRFAYVAGEMAGGIASTQLVIAMAKAEMLGFFGAAGLSLSVIEQAVDHLRAELRDRPNWGVNLIHSPNEPELEESAADLLIRKNVPNISVSAFLAPTLALVRCALTGLRRAENGQIERRIHLFAKVSRPEVAEWFLSPAPSELVRQLVQRGQLTTEEAELAKQVPLAEDITVEADSGGHTDNRPLLSLLPAILELRTESIRRFNYARSIRIGAAGGLGTPGGVAAAFAAGAAYVVTGSVNQASREAGLSEDAKEMLAGTDLADVMMAPAADMFEQGVRLQVLRRGTLFATRAARLYQSYVEYPSLEAIPTSLRVKIEQEILGSSIDEVWTETQSFWQQRNPAEITRAEQDPKHKMALVFRWYLGKSSRWAVEGNTARRADYQIWCGPAMGAFNRWTAGSFLADSANRSVVQIALNLLEGAAAITRAHQLRSYGVSVPAEAFEFAPRRLA